MAKKAKKNIVKAITNKDQYDLSRHSIEDLLKWRDIASTRVDKAREKMGTLSKEYISLNKKVHSDIKWIRRLHGALAKKVFGHRDHSKAL